MQTKLGLLTESKIETTALTNSLLQLWITEFLNILSQKSLKRKEEMEKRKN
jgi:hypothetical protein